MSRLYSGDRSMFATFGKSKNGMWSATIYVSGDGEEYPSFGIEKAEGFDSLASAKDWAEFRMAPDEEELVC